MRKIADLNFYAFTELYRILKSKFPLHHVVYQQNHSLATLSISSVSLEDIEVETVIEIDDPSPSGSDIEEMNISDTTMAIRLYVDGLSYLLQIEQATFDNDDFCQKLESLIGKIAPVRQKVDREELVKQMDEWVKQLIKDSGIEQYCISIKDEC